MNILVTGSKGTLGTPLVKELRKRGHRVYGAHRDHSDDPMEYRCNIQDFRQIVGLFDRIENQSGSKIDVVYHLAAEFGRINGEEYYEHVWKTNVIGTRNILELQKFFGFKLIHASSSEIYGELKVDKIIESMEPGVLSNDYAISKLVNEMQIRNFREKYQSKIQILRFFNSYGPGEYYTDYRSVCCLFCYRLLHDIPVTVFKNYHRVFMYIDDFIPTLANVCDRFVDGEIINIGGSEYRSVEELARIVLKETGKDESLLIFQPEDKHNVTNKFPDITKAQKMLGHNPKITLEEGIAKTVAWMRGVYGK